MFNSLATTLFNYVDPIAVWNAVENFAPYAVSFEILTLQIICSFWTR